MNMASASALKVVLFMIITSSKVRSLNTNVSVHDMVYSMIQMQHELCPYVSLCTRNETAVYKKTHDAGFPCCSQCSCNIDCMESGMCCPDIHGKHLEFQDQLHGAENQSLDFLDQLRKQYTTASVEIPKSPYELKCVKVNHGIASYSAGYKMIAECPRNYTNITTTELCTRNFDITRPDAIIDQVPVYESISGLSYKNRYCYVCNTDSAGRGQFWRVMFNSGGEFIFFSSFLSSPIDLIEMCLRHVRCSIIFNISNQNRHDIQPKLVKCTVETHVSSCKQKYAGTDLEKMCTQYTWPITKHIHVYRNYACMLCNDVVFKELCYPHKGRFIYTGSVNLGLSETLPIDKNAKSNTPSTINQFFPDSSGHVVCPKGFVSNQQTNICHQVICPLSFYIQDGACVPLFEHLTGVRYRSIVEVLLPNTLNGLDTASVERAIISAVKHTFLQCIDRSDFLFSLWSNIRTSGRVTSGRKYYIYFLVTMQGDFNAVTRFLYKFVVLKGRMKLRFKSHATRNFSIRLHFPEVFFFKGTGALGPSGEMLYLRVTDDNSWVESLLKAVQVGLVTVDVSKSFLCYRVALNTSEIKYLNRQTVLVLKTKAVITKPNFQFIKDQDKVFVCFEDAFGQMVNSKFIYPETVLTKSPVESRQINFSDLVIKSEDAKGHNEMFVRSLIASACSVGILVFIIGFRQMLKTWFKTKNRHVVDHINLSEIRRGNGQSISCEGGGIERVENYD